MTRGFGRTLAAAALAAMLGGAVYAADPPADTTPKALDKMVSDSLKDVHNHGADLYNLSKDYAGAYRVYEGALKTVRPLLAHRPAAQRTIADGLAAAAKEGDIAKRAYMLHETIETVRTDLKGAGTTPPKKTTEPKKTDDTKPVVPKKTTDPKKTPDPKKADDTKKPEPKKTDDTKKPADVKPADTKKPTETTKPDDTKKPTETTKPKDTATSPAPKPKEAAKPTAKVAGKVTLAGKPLAGGLVTFAATDSTPATTYSAAVGEDGTFSATSIPPGKYAVTVTPQKDGKIKLPAKYAAADKSGLTAEVKAGANTLDFALVP